MRPFRNCIALLLLFAAVFSSQSAYTHSSTDTLNPKNTNLLDNNGMRQGYWRITGTMLNEPGYRKDQVAEEGHYLDNKRNGVWKKYYPTGVLRSEIHYENNHPRGLYTTYYDNGSIEETGDWQGNRNVGSFKRYHRNGSLSQDFTFNPQGKRDGEQRYYYPNGELQMTVEVENGTAHGMLKNYDIEGKIKSEKRLVNGKVDEQSVKIYKTAGKQKFEEPQMPIEELTPAATDKTNIVPFKDTGFNTLYNRNQQITQVGEFVNGTLWNGKWHRYDSDGLLRKVEVYKGGRFVGYGIIEDSSK